MRKAGATHHDQYYRQSTCVVAAGHTNHLANSTPNGSLRMVATTGQQLTSSKCSTPSPLAKSAMDKSINVARADGNSSVTADVGVRRPPSRQASGLATSSMDKGDQRQQHQDDGGNVIANPIHILTTNLFHGEGVNVNKANSVRQISGITTASESRLCDDDIHPPSNSISSLSLQGLGKHGNSFKRTPRAMVAPASASSPFEVTKCSNVCSDYRDCHCSALTCHGRLPPLGPPSGMAIDDEEDNGSTQTFSPPPSWQHSNGEIGPENESTQTQLARRSEQHEAAAVQSNHCSIGLECNRASLRPTEDAPFPFHKSSSVVVAAVEGKHRCRSGASSSSSSDESSSSSLPTDPLLQSSSTIPT